MNKKSIILTIILIMLFLVPSIVNAEQLENDVEVEEKSILKYYLNVTYDGIDIEGVQSGETGTAQLYSGIMYVEDRIPEGLEFIGFETTQTGTIGAYKRSDGSICSGYVVDDTNESTTDSGVWNDSHTEYTYHGLHYTTSDRTVRFKIKNLNAGGKITVGIITKTPTIDDPETPEVEKRRDFYNWGSLIDGCITKLSNVVHAYMQKGDVNLFNVRYEYDGELPENAPELPSEMQYAENTKVGVAGPVKIEGYEFSGWETEDATISNQSFTMPNKDVVLKGRFIEAEPKTVTYKIVGEIPEGYVAPEKKEYYKNSYVIVDSLSEGASIKGYKFSGWTTDDVTISEDNDFIMGDNDVEIIGSFSQVKYKVEYKFIDNVLPPNSSNYLPATKEYAPGEIVNLESEPSAENYKFLGWHSLESFEMPEEDVIIYGSWMQIFGTFEPKIEKEIIDKKSAYQSGDKIDFKITITNQNDFQINDVIVKELNKDAEFIENSSYTKNSKSLVTIDSIEGGEQIVLYSTYIVKTTDEGTLKNEVQLLSAVASNEYTIADKEYIASCDFYVGDLKDIENGGNTKEESSDLKDGNGYTKEESKDLKDNDGNTNDLKENVESLVQKVKELLNPETGDGIFIYAILFVGSVIVFIIKAKNKKN